MRSLSFSIVLVSVVMWFSCSVALAEVDPLDPLAGDAAEAVPKQAKKETQKDPFPGLEKKVEEGRKALGERLNLLQSAAQKFADVEEKIMKASQLYMEAMDAYDTNHGQAINDYRSAESSGDKKAVAKAKKSVAKARKAFLKSIAKVNKGLNKLKKLEAKLAKQAAKEDAEDAKAKAQENPKAKD